jgi:hypothetical protein
LQALQDEQEVMADLADCIMAIYGLESALVRARKLVQAGAGVNSTKVAAAMTSAYAARALAQVEQAARRVLAAASEGDALGVQMAVLRRFARVAPIDEIALQQQVAWHFLEQGRYRI